MQSRGPVAGMTALLVLCGGAARAQETSAPKSTQLAAPEASKDGAPVALTLKRAIELALGNSKKFKLRRFKRAWRIAPPRLRSHSSCPISMRALAQGTPTAYRKRQADAHHRSSTCRTRNRFSTNRCAARRKRQRSSPKRRRLPSRYKEQRDHANGDGLSGIGEGAAFARAIAQGAGSAEKILQVTQDRQGEGYELPVEVTKPSSGKRR